MLRGNLSINVKFPATVTHSFLIPLLPLSATSLTTHHTQPSPLFLYKKRHTIKKQKTIILELRRCFVTPNRNHVTRGDAYLIVLNSFRLMEVIRHIGAYIGVFLDFGWGESRCTWWCRASFECVGLWLSCLVTFTVSLLKGQIIRKLKLFLYSYGYP
jgi:hypothetical protein